MAYRQRPVHDTAIPLQNWMLENRKKGVDVARQLNISQSQTITNWLARGIPAYKIPDVAKLCGFSTDQYLSLVGLSDRASIANEGATTGQDARKSENEQRMIAAFGWLTNEQQNDLLRDIEAKAETNKAISRELSGKWEFKPDAEVANHITPAPKAEKPRRIRK